MAKERRPGLPRGLRQRAEVAGHWLRYLVCVREVLLKEFVVRVVMICVHNRKGTPVSHETPQEDPRDCSQACSLQRNKNESPASSRGLHGSFYSSLGSCLTVRTDRDTLLSYSLYFPVFF